MSKEFGKVSNYAETLERKVNKMPPHPVFVAQRNKSGVLVLDHRCKSAAEAKGGEHSNPPGPKKQRTTASKTQKRTTRREADTAAEAKHRAR